MGVYRCYGSDDEINIKVLYTLRHFIHVLVKQTGGRTSGMTATYASPHHHLRNGLWDELNLINCRDPWLFIGDFNCTLKNGERNSKGGTSRSIIKWTEEKALMDLNFIGP